jgi:hypothetical protein
MDGRLTLSRNGEAEVDAMTNGDDDMLRRRCVSCMCIRFNGSLGHRVSGQGVSGQGVSGQGCPDTYVLIDSLTHALHLW